MSSEIRDFLDYIASVAACNGADSEGQRFYDWGLNPWLTDRLAEFIPMPCPGCDNYGVIDGLDPCPKGCPISIEVMAGLMASGGGPGPCVKCGRDPAAGFASTWTADKGEQWYCHPDEGPSCYSGDVA